MRMSSVRDSQRKLPATTPTLPHRFHHFLEGTIRDDTAPDHDRAGEPTERHLFTRLQRFMRQQLEGTVTA